MQKTVSFQGFSKRMALNRVDVDHNVTDLIKMNMRHNL